MVIEIIPRFLKKKKKKKKKYFKVKCQADSSELEGGDQKTATLHLFYISVCGFIAIESIPFRIYWQQKAQYGHTQERP